MSELKEQIQSAINAFASGDLLTNAGNLLKVLGYESDRTFLLTPNTFAGFWESFGNQNVSFDKDKARKDEWQSIDIIFQLTEDDIRKTHSLFAAKQVDNTIIESYLFFALSLTGDKYTRGDLVRITREINKLTPMPAMILFQYNNFLTIAVIDRRLHKREGSKDVLEKVTLIKEINLVQPHRAHIEILFDLSLNNLNANHSVSNFVELHNAWRKTLDTTELNKKFYRELANWYFWAIQNVEFPDDAEKDKNIRNATNVIRLITRVIFVWFLKEKGLIPEDLFNQTRLKQILNYKDKNNSTYYKAILHNLFFATLNTEMNTKDKPDSRKFRGKNKGGGQDQHYMIHNVFRYEDYFLNPQNALKMYFDNIPFLNGGLFECLDKVVTNNGKDNIVRIDGFSDHPMNVLNVPDSLFFSTEKEIDLNETYGTKNKTYKVKGLINILSNYKFTVDENTPIEEEVALDPELLGKVFENLLASYNPETGSTARKQTGSFYTPREIVNYMVDESLIVYLHSKLPSPLVSETSQIIPSPLRGEGKGEGERQSRESGNPEQKLRRLLSYTDDPHQFSPEEVDALIEAIDNAKILDPACGSGAFPMGILHKLVYILGKLDPHNEKWKQKQIDKVMEVSDTTVREKLVEDIEQSFQNNELDYGRKLYLIENSIFGVDIQPIAVQIAKLRFFISLIVDQKTETPRHSRESGNPEIPNLGIRPLPNLETKFVAANTLIGIEKPLQERLSVNLKEIDRKEKELKQIRERHFTARTLKTKREYRKKDEQLREEIANLLADDGFPIETTNKLIKWDPYDQNASASFFDPEWMFSIRNPSPPGGEGQGEGGFDVVIGNPPYIQIQSFTGRPEQKEWENQKYATYVKTGDVYCLFYEKGFNLLAPDGVLTYITSNKWMRANYGKVLRKFFLEQCLTQLIDFGDSPIFENATTYTNILVQRKGKSAQQMKVWDLSKAYESDVSLKIMLEKQGLSEPLFSEDSFVIATGGETHIKKRIEEVGVPLRQWDIAINYGIKTGMNEAFIINGKKKDELIVQGPKSAEIIKPILRGRDIKRYKADFSDLWMIATYPALNIDINKYSAVRDYLRSFGKNWNRVVSLAAERKRITTGSRCRIRLRIIQNLKRKKLFLRK